MIRPMTFWQKVIAYTSLLFVLICTVFGVFAIYVILKEGS